MCDSVNWANAQLDGDALGHLMTAFRSSKCRLKRCKLSLRSIEGLDPQVIRKEN